MFNVLPRPDAVSLGRTRIPIPVVKAVDDSSSELDSEKFLEDIKEKVNLVFLIRSNRFSNSMRFS